MFKRSEQEKQVREACQAAKAMTRRELLQGGSYGLGALALTSCLNGKLFGEVKGANPLRAKQGHFAGGAKRVIYIHLIGAPSQLDLFDYKPELIKHHNELVPKHYIEGQDFAFLRGHPRLMGSPFKFRRYGKCGMEMSELLPELGGVADDLTLIKSVHTSQINHAPAQLFLQTGHGLFGRPSFGAWVTYGLGTENQNLPAYVVMVTGSNPGAGNALWGNGFLPSVYQGVEFRSSGDPVLFLSNPKGVSREDRRRVLDDLKAMNELKLADVNDPEIATRIAQYEMSFKMQMSVPEMMDLSNEPASIREMYGVGKGGGGFANNCLLARRLVERGVRVVQLFDQGWDHHGGINNNLPKKCKQIDRPVAGLIKDLKQRGLLEDTLVIVGGEFGRTPMMQGSNGDGNKTAAGRDHHKDAFTVMMAGGGLKPGYVYGETDDLGYQITKNPCHVHDLNATILHAMGFDHERLTFKYQGRDFRLTDVHGVVQKDIFI